MRMKLNLLRGLDVGRTLACPQQNINCNRGHPTRSVGIPVLHFGAGGSGMNGSRAVDFPAEKASGKRNRQPEYRHEHEQAASAKKAPFRHVISSNQRHNDEIRFGQRSQNYTTSLAEFRLRRCCGIHSFRCERNQECWPSSHVNPETKFAISPPVYSVFRSAPTQLLHSLIFGLSLTDLVGPAS